MSGDHKKAPCTQVAIVKYIYNGINTKWLECGVVHLIRSKWEEEWDEKSFSKYMGILETATVLEKIHDKFAGMKS